MSVGDHWREVDWSRAACRGVGVGVFFPETRADVREAKQYCHDCPIRKACLRYAVNAREVGVWGGMTDDERRAMVRRIKHARRER